MDPITAAIIGGGLGLFKTGEQKRNNYNQMLFDAELAKVSPWSKLSPGAPPTNPSALGNIMEGATSGAAFGQGLEGKDSFVKLLDILKKKDSSSGDSSTVQDSPYAQVGDSSKVKQFGSSLQW